MRDEHRIGRGAESSERPDVETDPFDGSQRDQRDNRDRIVELRDQDRVRNGRKVVDDRSDLLDDEPRGARAP